MKTQNVIRTFAAGAVIALLLIIIALIVVFLQFNQNNSSSIVTDKFAGLEFSYDGQIFQVINQNANKQPTLACEGICLRSIPQNQFGDAHAELSITNESQLSESECLLQTVRPEEQIKSPNLPNLLVADISQQTNTADSARRLRIYTKAHCYELGLVITRDVPTEKNSESAQYLYDKSLEIVKSIKVAGYNTNPLVSLANNLPLVAFPKSGINQEPEADPLINLKAGTRLGEVIFESAEYVIRLMNVTEDSRCPVEVQCVYAGQLIVTLEVFSRSTRQASTLEVEVGEETFYPGRDGGLQIMIAVLKPERSINSEISKSDYLFQASIKALPQAVVDEGDETDSPEPSPVNECVRAGCSGQLCISKDAAAAGGGVSTCEYRAEYACYQSAICEPQANGQCGFTPSPALEACLLES